MEGPVDVTGGIEVVDAYRRASVWFGPVQVDYDDRVLSPRGWTLMQSRWAAELAGVTRPARLLELCAGAGQIGLVAAMLARVPLVQIEADPVAAGYARFNADRAGWGACTEIRVGALQSMLAPDERFAAVVADPPYLPSDALARWPNDPAAAIDGGDDGLDVIDRCLSLAAHHLVTGGWMLLQVAGVPQADQVAGLVEKQGGSLTIDRVRTVDQERAVMHLVKT